VAPLFSNFLAPLGSLLAIDAAGVLKLEAGSLKFGFLPLLALDFGSAGMLWFLAGAAAPILIHLWNRRKYKEVTWAAMEYLLAAIRKNARRVRIEQLILLAVRTLALLLLALAVAEPFLERTGVSSVASRRTHKLLIVDGSFSMGYKPTDKSRFERAKELAAQIVEESNQGDGFTLLMLADPPRVVVGTPVFERADFLEEIDHLRLPHAGGDLPTTIEKAIEVLATARREFPKLVQHEVYFLTDLGRTSWEPDFESSAAQEAFRDRSRQLAEQAAVVMVDLGQPDAANTALTDLRLSSALATVGRYVNLEATVKNFGPQPLAQKVLHLVIDDRPVADDTLDIDAGGTATVAFSHQFDTPGEHTVEVRLAHDELPIDDRRFLSIPVKDKLRVLCVNGAPSGEPFAGATDYLLVALGHWRNPQRNPILCDPATERALTERDLQVYDAIFLCNVGQFSRAEAQQLHAYLKGGGGLIFFLGDRVQADSYNQRLAGVDPAEPRVLPARIGSVVTAPLRPGEYTFDPLEYQHPIVQVFRNNEQVGFLSTPVYKYFQLLPLENSRAQVALKFAGGDPAIVEERLGRGRSIVVAVPAGMGAEPWTLLPSLQNFLPLVHEILMAAIVGQAQQRNVLVGQPLGGTLAAADAQDRVRIETPWKSIEHVRPQADGDAAQWTFGGADESGLYQALLPGATPRTLVYAVNVDTRESDLTKLSLQDLAADTWRDVPFVSKENFKNLDEMPMVTLTQRSFLHWWLLCCVAGLLFLETLLAWLFGT
jgi:hypothetical protein